ncbi:MAG: hypothetical protein ACR2MM_02840 [Flavobacteriaceae bacterium]
MPITTYWEPEGFVYETSGVVTAHEIFDSGTDFLEVPEGVIPKYQLINALNIEKFDLSEVDVVDISADDLSASRKYPNIKVAMVAQKGHVIEKFMNYLKVSWAINTSWEIRIFNSLAAARDWLSHVAEIKKPGTSHQSKIQH